MKCCKVLPNSNVAGPCQLTKKKGVRQGGRTFYCVLTAWLTKCDCQNSKTMR